MNQSTLLPNGFQENMTGRRLQSPYQENDLDDSDDSTPFEETPGYAKRKKNIQSKFGKQRHSKPSKWKLLAQKSKCRRASAEERQREDCLLDANAILKKTIEKLSFISPKNTKDSSQNSNLRYHSFANSTQRSSMRNNFDGSKDNENRSISFHRKQTAVKTVK